MVERWDHHVARFSSTTMRTASGDVVISYNWDEIQAWLSAAGEDGWELVSTHVENLTRATAIPTNVICFLKRHRAE